MDDDTGWDAGRDDEELLLALLNSRPVVDGVELDALGADRDARSWLREHGFRPTAVPVAQLRQVRDVLGEVVHGRVPAAALHNLVPGVRAELVVDENGARWSLVPGGADEVTVRATLAWAAVTRTMPGRLRPCGNPECQLFLVDRSRAGTARWCSMATCGNRMKARRHHARTRH